MVERGMGNVSLLKRPGKFGWGFPCYFGVTD